jgi:hypothetical protein
VALKESSELLHWRRPARGQATLSARARAYFSVRAEGGGGTLHTGAQFPPGFELLYISKKTSKLGSMGIDRLTDNPQYE